MTVIGVVFTIVTGYIAYRGVTGSTVVAIWINIIQWVTLIIFTGLAIWYRIANPQHATQWAFSGGLDIIKIHSLQGILVQSTIAILILVGFESCTALAAETKDPQTTIPKAIIISLIVQGLFAYLFQYFGAGFMISEKLVNTTGHDYGNRHGCCRGIRRSNRRPCQADRGFLVPWFWIRFNDYYGNYRSYCGNRDNLKLYEYGNAGECGYGRRQGTAFLARFYTH